MNRKHPDNKEAIASNQLQQLPQLQQKLEEEIIIIRLSLKLKWKLE